MAAGRLLLGIGAETFNIFTLAAIAQYFTGRNIALAMGLNLAISRGGSFSADMSPSWFARARSRRWSSSHLQRESPTLTTSASGATWKTRDTAAERKAAGPAKRNRKAALAVCYRIPAVTSAKRRRQTTHSAPVAAPVVTCTASCSPTPRRLPVPIVWHEQMGDPTLAEGIFASRWSAPNILPFPSN